MRWKVDETGNYLRFPGLTVVSSIKKEDYGWAKRIFNAINQMPELREHYSPLPYESYHLTTTNLYTEKDEGQWEEFVTGKKPFLYDLRQTLTNNAFDTSIVDISHIITKDVLQLVVELPKTQVEIINQIALKHGIHSKIPPYFHITLAYMFKSATVTEQKLLSQKAIDTLAPILEQRPTSFLLNPPELCFFNDMTQFIRWNGEDAPFDVPKPSVNSSSHTMFGAVEVDSGDQNTTKPGGSTLTLS